MFDNIIGHENIKRHLESIVKEKRFANTYLFSGPAKVGKFSTARELAVEILGKKYEKDIYSFIFPDFTVVYPFLKKNIDTRNAYIEGLRMELINRYRDGLDDVFFDMGFNDNIPIDVVRELQFYAGKKAFISDRKVIIVKNAEKMRKEGANSFLKLLEEPPDNTIIILTTDNLSSILPTIVSRCQLLKFGYIANSEIQNYLLSTTEYKKESGDWVYDGTFGNLRLSSIVLKHMEINRTIRSVLDKNDMEIFKIISDIQNEFAALEKKENKERKKRKTERKSKNSTVNLKQESLVYLLKLLMKLINTVTIENYNSLFDRSIIEYMRKNYSKDKLENILKELIIIEADIRKNIIVEKTITYLITLFSVKEVYNVYQG